MSAPQPSAEPMSHGLPDDILAELRSAFPEGWAAFQARQGRAAETSRDLSDMPTLAAVKAEAEYADYEPPREVQLALEAAFPNLRGKLVKPSAQELAVPANKPTLRAVKRMYPDYSPPHAVQAGLNELRIRCEQVVAARRR